MYDVHACTCTYTLCHVIRYVRSAQYSITLHYDCTQGDSNTQGNLRTRDTMGPTILSLVERSSLSQRSNNTQKYKNGVEKGVLCKEVALNSEGPLSEVQL